MRRSCFLALSLVTTLLTPSPALAAGPLPAQNRPLQTSSYSIDMFQGPVLASARPTGLGGSYAGIAEGVDGNAVNAAAPAFRVPWSHDWFDYDLTAGITFPNSLRKTDFDNNGSTGFTYGNFYFGTVGGNVQFGEWGFGVLADGQLYQLRGMQLADGSSPNLNVVVIRGHGLMAKSFLDGQLIVGAGLRLASFSINANTSKETSSGDVATSSTELFKVVGTSPEAGVIWAPHNLPLRLGLSGRGPVSGKADPSSPTVPNAEGDTIIGVMYLPDHIELPWEVEAGFSLQIGRRRLNIPWINPHVVIAPLTSSIDRARAGRTRRKDAAARAQKALEEDRLRASRKDARARLKARYLAQPRQKLLLTGSLLVSGPVKNAIGVESFFAQVVDRSGERVSLTPRLGLESEVVEGILQLRTGSYLEPTRFRGGSPRVHGTAGFDLKLFNWSVFGLFDDDTHWRAGGVIDVTRAYLGWGVSVGVWH